MRCHPELAFDPPEIRSLFGPFAVVAICFESLLSVSHPSV